MKRVVVIGTGIFGFNVVKRLFESGVEVIAIDKDKDAVQKVRDYCTKAILADGTDKSVMESLALTEDDVAIVSFGEDLAASTLITLHLKQMNVKTIIVKVPNEEHRIILEKIGATDVIIPEKEMAEKVVKSIVTPNVVDYIPLTDDYMICEIEPPNHFQNKTLGELQFRAAYNVYVIAVRHTDTERVEMMPPAGHVITANQQLVIIGKDSDIAKIK